MDEEINLLELFVIVRNKLKQIVAISVLCGVAVFIACVFVLTPKYTSYVDLYVTNVSVQGDELNAYVNANDLSASQKLLSTYKVILRTDEAYNKLVSVTGIQLSKSELLGMISFSSLESTEVLRITAETPDPYLSKAICDGYTTIAPEIIQDVFNGGSVKSLSTAKADGEPSSPNTTLYTLVGFVGGFCMAAVLYILLELFTNTVRGEQELSSKMNVAVIGTVPDFFSIKELRIPKAVQRASKKITANSTTTNNKLITDYTLLGRNSPFVVTEAYNMIRTNLAFSLSTSDSKTIIVSSSLPNECKSTSVVNLAISMAQTGVRVLLVEGDLRNPTLHRIFQRSNRKGLSRVLAGIDSASDAIQQDVRPGLDLLTGGSVPPNPSELLGSDNMGRLLTKLSSYYDYIFIDTPPINVVSDAMLLARHAAGIIMVVREGKTKYSDLNKALNKVEITRCNLLGVVLTDSERMSSGYGDYRYGYGYGQTRQSN